MGGFNSKVGWGASLKDVERIGARSWRVRSARREKRRNGVWKRAKVGGKDPRSRAARKEYIRLREAEEKKESEDR